MTRYAVLLRGINVGRAKRIAMADLRTLLTGLGHTDVATLGQSGNIALTSGSEPDEVAAGVHDAVLADIGVESRVLVCTRDEVTTIVAANPLAHLNTDGSRMMAGILSAAPDPALVAEHDALALDPENTALGERVVYQWCPDGVLAAPPVAAFIEKHWDVGVTARNWNTMTKLAALLDG